MIDFHLNNKITAAKTSSRGALTRLLGSRLVLSFTLMSFMQDSTSNTIWWQSSWFLGGLILLVVGGTTWFIIWQLRKRRSREKELEALVAESTQELAFAQAQISTLFENSPLAIGTASMDGVILTANDAMATIFGYPEDELIGIEIMDFFPDHALREALIERLIVEKTIEPPGSIIQRSKVQCYKGKTDPMKVMKRGLKRFGR